MNQIRVPAEAFPPGESVREDLEERGWSQADLADILGKTPAFVNEIVSGKRGVTTETAQGLAEAFGGSPQYWLNLEASYRLWLKRDRSPDVARRARIYDKAPVRDMIRRRWIEPSRNPEVLEERLLDFLGIASLDDEPVIWPHAARKSTSYADTTPTQTAWLMRARQVAAVVQAGPYNRRNMPVLIRRLRDYMAEPAEARHVPAALAEAGIRFIIIEPLPGSKMDGATLWLDAESPVVVLSMRYDRIDYFWFTLMHELRHVEREDGLKGNTPVDADLGNDGPKNLPDFEIAVNQEATESLVPSDRLDDFILRTGPFFQKKRIIGFATLQGIHPGIVVGQLQRREQIGYSQSRDLLVKVREILTRAALTDGWGQHITVS